MFPVSDPQIKLTHCLLAALCMKVTVGVLLLTFHKEFHSNRGRVFQESRTEFSTYLLSRLSLSVFLCLSPSSCAPWSVPSGRPDAAAAAVSRLHASDQHVICQICHLSSTLRHHGTLFWNKVFFGLNLKVFFPENKILETLKSVSRSFCSVFTVRCMTTWLKITMRSHSGTATSSSTLSPSTRAGCTAPCREPASPACCRQTTWSVATKAERKTSLWERGPEIHSYIHLQRYKSSWWCSLHFRAHLHFQCYGKRERQVIDC